MVIAKTGACRVQSIVPNQREWLSVLVCVNAAGKAIPSFYIFRGKRFGQNYIQHCEDGATMAMQPRAWMTTYLFSAWLDHFVASVGKVDTISENHRHLLILDGHNSHVTLEVAKAAMHIGLDLLTLPSHTSHALQPLDLSVFKPFKQHFRMYRDYWMSRNLDIPASKDILAQWVSLSLRKALTEKNIQSGFRKAGIHPLNKNAVDYLFVTSEIFRNSTGAGEGNEPDAASQPSGDPPTVDVACSHGSDQLQFPLAGSRRSDQMQAPLACSHGSDQVQSPPAGDGAEAACPMEDVPANGEDDTAAAGVEGMNSAPVIINVEGCC